MNLCIFEDEKVRHLLPLSATRPVYDLRIGLRTRCGELERDLEADHLFLHSREYLAEWTAREYDALTNRIPSGLGVLFINGRAIPDDQQIHKIKSLADATGPTGLFQEDDLIAAWLPSLPENFEPGDYIGPHTFGDIESIAISEVRMLDRLWDLIVNLPGHLDSEFQKETKGYNIFERPGVDLSDSANLVNGEQIYIGSGSTIRAGAVINATEGPVYIDEGVTIFENAVVRGPAFIGKDSQVRVGANLKRLSVGPVCKIGGEVHDTVIHSYSSKVHDGFLGHSYIGRWCNLGAGTCNSNLRNDYKSVNLYNVASGEYEDSGLQFLGLFLGDHSKSSIASTFNTGTVAGVSCNLFGSGFHARHIPSFRWGSPPDNYDPYLFDKAKQVARAVMARRGHDFTAVDESVLARVHEESQTPE